MSAVESISARHRPVAGGLRRRARQVRSVWRRAHFAIGPSARLIAPLSGLAVVGGFAEAGVLALIAQAAFSMSTDSGPTDLSLGPISIGSVGAMLALACVLAVVRVAVQWALAWLAALMSSQTQSRLRRMLFSAYAEASWSTQSRDRGGQLQEMMTSQTKQATAGAMVVAGALSPLITFLILVGSAVFLNPMMALSVAVAAVGIFLFLRPFGRMGRRQAALQSAASLKLAEGVGETVSLTEEMHVYGTASQHKAHVDGLIDDVEAPFFRSQLLALGVPTLHQGLALLLVIAGLASVYALGADNLGSLGAIVLLLIRALSYGQQLQASYQKLNNVSPFLDRIARDVERYRQSAPESGTALLPSVVELAFDEVSFAYNVDQPVLSDLSFTVEAGETVGIIGTSGAGKSTLVQILLRLRDPVTGTYRVNGEDVRRFAAKEWQRRIAFVSQEPRLLAGTVAQNIRYYREWLTEEDVERAARLAHVHDEIVSWTGGYDHPVGQRLDAVSGGQRQRLCLARALADRPEILVLDEPTSALDPRSEAAIQESLAELRGAVTMFIVAHRMSTLRGCDRIMVIEAGRLTAFDRPEHLWHANGYFRSAMELAGVNAGGGAP
jgi:ATP-binding cassette subfamily B protein